MNITVRFNVQSENRFERNVSGDTPIRDVLSGFLYSFLCEKFHQKDKPKLTLKENKEILDLAINIGVFTFKSKCKTAFRAKIKKIPLTFHHKGSNYSQLKGDNLKNAKHADQVIKFMGSKPAKKLNDYFKSAKTTKGTFLEITYNSRQCIHCILNRSKMLTKWTKLPSFKNQCGKCSKQSPKDSPFPVCKNCKFVHYCSVQCQREHWKKHKSSCRKYVKKREKDEAEKRRKEKILAQKLKEKDAEEAEKKKREARAKKKKKKKKKVKPEKKIEVTKEVDNKKVEEQHQDDDFNEKVDNLLDKIKQNTNVIEEGDLNSKKENEINEEKVDIIEEKVDIIEEVNVIEEKVNVIEEEEEENIIIPKKDPEVEKLNGSFESEGEGEKVNIEENISENEYNWESYEKEKEIFIKKIKGSPEKKKSNGEKNGEMSLEMVKIVNDMRGQNVEIVFVKNKMVEYWKKNLEFEKKFLALMKEKEEERIEFEKKIKFLKESIRK